VKRRNFTLSVKNDIGEIQKKVEMCPKWAWIIHDEDVDKDTGEMVPVHLHAYIEFPNPRSFESVSDQLGIPPNMILKVIDKKGLLQYFTHTNQPEKHLYSMDEISSNFDVKPFYEKFDDSLFSDYASLRAGVMSPPEFYENHKQEINESGFYPRLRIFDLIYSAGSRANEARDMKVRP
jgi:plasmid replication protein RepB